MNTDWASLLAVPTEEIVQRRDVILGEQGAGVLWSLDPGDIRELSALGALAWEGREGRPSESGYDWVGFNLLCNVAPTPFTLNEERFSCVDSFHEALKFPEGTVERTTCAMVSALEARKLARRIRGETFSYRGKLISVGSTDHEGLVAAGISAKVGQNPAVRMALRETANARLVFPLTYTDRPGPLGRVTPLALMIERWKEAVGRRGVNPLSRGKG